MSQPLNKKKIKTQSYPSRLSIKNQHHKIKFEIKQTKKKGKTDIFFA